MNWKALSGGIGTIIVGVATYWLTQGWPLHRPVPSNPPIVKGQDGGIGSNEKISAEPSPPPRMSELEMDVNRDGSDIRDFVAANIDECLDTCRLDNQCKAITFTKSSRQCWMKSAVPLRSNNPSYISAVKIE